ncbi:MAG: LysR family transcriptional regulator [Deltaproteobacteria bacterium]|nr:LysR family transcriptional regulator [Deltaproteobacteria bacterium]
MFHAGSIVEAANMLHVTSSAVSQAIKNLEQEIGELLFQRLRKTLVPTKAAENLNQVVDPFLQQLKQVLKDLNQVKIEAMGRLRIGAPPMVGSKLLVPLLAKFKETYPAVSFDLMLATPPVQVELLAKNQLDFAIVDNVDVFSKMIPVKVTKLMSELQLMVCSSKYYKQKLQGDISFSRIARGEFITYVKEATDAKLWFKHQFAKVPDELTSVLSVDNVDAVLSAIRGHFGLGLLPKHLVEAEVKSGALIPIKSTKRDYVNEIGVLQLLGRKPALVETRCIEFLTKNFNV